MSNFEEFRKRMPFPLIPTNVPGAFTSPPPPEGFDPHTAKPSDLVKHGIHWRRPQKGDDRRWVAAWERLFSRRWQAKNQIVPHLEPRKGRTHRVKRLKKVDAGYTDSAWAGGVVTGNFVSAVGTWVIPTVSTPSQPQGTEQGGGWKSSSWVGIDGFFTTNDVLQAGIEQYVDSTGNASYVAWYEWYAPPQTGSPAYIYQTNIPNFPVGPGKTVSCSAQYINNNTAGHLNFGNETTGQYFPITLAPPPGANFSGASIEWIMEAPDFGVPITSLPKFTPVQFTDAFGCQPNTKVVGDPANGDYVNVSDPSGNSLTSVTLATTAVTINFIG